MIIGWRSSCILFLAAILSVSHFSTWVPDAISHRCLVIALKLKTFAPNKQDYSVSLFGRKFFDFGFGNATDYYQIIDRPDYIAGNGNGNGSTADDDAGGLNFAYSISESTVVSYESQI